MEKTMENLFSDTYVKHIQQQAMKDFFMDAYKNLKHGFEAAQVPTTIDESLHQTYIEHGKSIGIDVFFIKRDPYPWVKRSDDAGRTTF